MTALDREPDRVRRANGVGPREHDVLRVAARSGWEHREALAREALGWAAAKTGQKLPDPLDGLQPFQALAGGRSVQVETLTTGATDFWCLRVEDPDRAVPGRVWTCEVTLGGSRDGPLRVTIRLLVNSWADDVGFVPAIPRVFSHATTGAALRVDGRPLRLFERVATADAADGFIDLVENPARRLPVVALSEARAPDEARIDPDRLGRQLLGLAHVAVLSDDASWALTDRLGQRLSVFGGAVRIYEPGFDADADPYAHRLFLAHRMKDAAGPEAVKRDVARAVAGASLLRERLGRDVLTFSELRNAATRVRSASLAADPGMGDDTRELARVGAERIGALEASLQEAQGLADYAIEEQAHERERAEAAEARLRGALARVAALEAALAARPDAVAVPAADPGTWAELVEWIHRDLAGRVALAPSALRSVKKTVFGDIGAVAAALRWLAGPALDSLLGRGGPPIAEARVADGVLNSHCGADAFRFTHDGRSLAADWHVKSGGNTRDPVRCLRVYWGFDADAGQIVVAHFPSHRITEAT